MLGSLSAVLISSTEPVSVASAEASTEDTFASARSAVRSVAAAVVLAARVTVVAFGLVILASFRTALICAREPVSVVTAEASMMPVPFALRMARMSCAPATPVKTEPKFVGAVFGGDLSFSSAAPTNPTAPSMDVMPEPSISSFSVKISSAVFRPVNTLPTGSAAPLPPPPPHAARGKSNKGRRPLLFLLAVLATHFETNLKRAEGSVGSLISERLTPSVDANASIISSASMTSTVASLSPHKVAS